MQRPAISTRFIAPMLLAAAVSFQANAEGTYMVPAGAPDYVRAAVTSSDRTEQQTARDSNRKPAEVLMLSGVKPGDTVVEFAGFGQYYTTMISSIVGANGKVYMFDLPYTAERAEAGSRAMTGRTIR